MYDLDSIILKYPDKNIQNEGVLSRCYLDQCASPRKDKGVVQTGLSGHDLVYVVFNL